MVENGEKSRRREEKELATPIFSRFKYAITFFGKSNPSLTSLNFDFEFGMNVRERESLMVIFVSASFGVGNIYHRIRNGERRLTVVLILRLVVRKARWWCNPTFAFL